MPKLDALLKILKDKNGSDLHLSPGNPPLLRISGDLVPAAAQKMTHEENQALIYEIMSDVQRSQFDSSHDIDFAYEVPALEARFRVNIFYGRLGITGVFRLIPTRIVTAEQLGLPPAVLKLTQLKKGLVVVTGPTG